MASYRDTEQLITEVQTRPILWDSTMEDYKDKNAKVEAWLNVCRAIDEDFEEKGKTEQNYIGKEIQARWKSIRDSYIKDCKRFKSESKSGAAPSRRYLFSEHLSFLGKVIGSRAAANGLPSPQGAAATESAPPSASNGDPTATAEPSEKRRKLPLDDKRLCHLEDRHHCQQQQHDDDRDFFMSMLPAVRTLNEHQKLSFRIQVLQMLQKIKAEQSSRSASMSKPPPDQ
ncbi:uncharacterized protein LOC122248078 [Penaeus japonicus]|uniref:uncharacterized protein LOC122248078 n=1 Tax=Penaeus japonicus TaxID=27405 RepID=UPI001C71022C|nr:uncharacterized protein LOC122248078 [Penaeus japonicus]